MGARTRIPLGPSRPRVILHYWGRRGGGSQFTLFLAQHLRNAGGKTDVVLSLAQQNDDIASFRAGGFPIVAMDRPGLPTLWRKGWSLPQQLRRHADTLAALKPDTVIITMNSPFAWPFIRMLQRRGLKVAYVAHDAEPHPGDYAATWQRTTQDILIRRADQVVTLSTSVAVRLHERIPAARDKISVIPLETVYPANDAPVPGRPQAEAPIRLLFFGRLIPYKGLRLLAEALEPLRSHPNWQLTIAGSGPLEPEVRKLFGEWGQVTLELGWISNDRISELFLNHHLLVCPYVEASQSGVVAQALTWAMPSLVMPTGALPEQVGFGAAGLVAGTPDADGLRRSLRTLIEEPCRLPELSRGAAALLAERHRNRGWVQLIEAARGQHRPLTPEAPGE